MDAKKCRVCQEPLTTLNCCQSFLDYGINICRVCDMEASKNRYSKRRPIVLQRLGGKCACCGTDDLNLLSIDHINGGGHKAAKKLRGKNYITKLFYMEELELFSTYQALCFNCNYARGFWGICPHQFCDANSVDMSLLPISDRNIKHPNLSDQERKERDLILRQINRIKIRLEMIKAYGNECVMCHITHPLFLTIDHINNNGNHDLAGTDFYQQLKRLGYPGKDTQLQLLCHNCNSLKEYIENRKNGAENIITTPEIYIKQPYQLSKLEEQALWEQARILYAQINHEL